MSYVNQSQQSHAQKLQRDAFVTTASGLLGVLASVILDVVVMGLFGLGSETDAYFVASTIPMVMITVMALQASKVVQPMFISTREQAGEAESWRWLSLTITMGTWFAIVVGIFSAWFSQLIVRIQAPGFDSYTLALGTTLGYFFSLSMLITGPVAIMRVALNSVGEFGIAGAGRFIDGVFKILFVGTLSQTMGIFSLSLGAVVGAIAQLLVFYFCLRQRGYRFEYMFRMRDPQLRRAVRLMLYPLGGQLSGAVVDVLSNNLTSLLGPGMVTALRFATRIIDTLAGVLANSVVTAAMPLIAGAVARHDKARVMEHLLQSIRLLLAITIPLSFWLALVNRPLIALAYQRMKFTASDAELVSSILVLMIPYIFLSRLLGLAELPFFAIGNTRTPTRIAVMQAGICALLMYMLFTSLAVYAVPLARIVSYLLTSIYLWILVSSYWGSLNLRRLADSAVSILLASSIMGVCVILGQQLELSTFAEGFLIDVLRLVVPSFLGAMAALCVLILLKMCTICKAENFPFVKLSFHLA